MSDIPMDDSAQGISGDPSREQDEPEESDEDAEEEQELAHKSKLGKRLESDVQPKHWDELRQARDRVGSLASPTEKRQKTVEVLPRLREKQQQEKEPKFDLLAENRDLTPAERYTLDNLNTTQRAHFKKRFFDEIAAETLKSNHEKFFKQAEAEWHRRTIEASAAARAIGRKERERELKEENAEMMASQKRQLTMDSEEKMAKEREEQGNTNAQQLREMQAVCEEKERGLQQLQNSLDAREREMAALIQNQAGSLQESLHQQLTAKDQQLVEAKARIDQLCEEGRRQQSELEEEKRRTANLRQETVDYKESLDRLELEGQQGEAMELDGLQHDEIDDLSERVARCSITEDLVDPVDQTSGEAVDLRKAYDECGRLQQALKKEQSQSQEVTQTLRQYKAELAEHQRKAHRLEEEEKERGKEAKQMASLLEEKEAEVVTLGRQLRQQQSQTDEASSLKIDELGQRNLHLQTIVQNHMDYSKSIEITLSENTAALKKANENVQKLQATIRANGNRHGVVVAQLKDGEGQLTRNADTIKDQSARISQLDMILEDRGYELQSVKRDAEVAWKEWRKELEAKERAEAKVGNLGVEIAALKKGKEAAELKASQEADKHGASQARLNQVKKEQKKLNRQFTESCEKHEDVTSELRTAKAMITKLEKDKKGLQTQSAKSTTEIVELRKQLGLPDVSPVFDASEELDVGTSWNFLGWPMLSILLVILFLLGLGLLTSFRMEEWWSSSDTAFPEAGREMWISGSREMRQAMYYGKVLGGFREYPRMPVSGVYYG